MASSFSSLTDNLVQGLHKAKCKDCKFSLEHVTAKDGPLIFKCVRCSKTYEKTFDEDLCKRFENTYQSFDGHMVFIHIST